MTEGPTTGPTTEAIATAISMIDANLLELRSRELTRSDQVADLLLDLRLLLATADREAVVAS